MQSNTSRPVKKVEEKRSKWKLFGKSTNKSTERLVEPQARQRHSDASATSEDSHKPPVTDESATPIDRSKVTISSPREVHPAILPRQHVDFHAIHGSNSGSHKVNGTMQNTSLIKEIHPGLMATQSGISIEKVFQPQSVLSSSSTPTVRQETYTDPITGETMTKTITTVVTETTTTQIIKPPVPLRGEDLDVEEEKRLAKEYLAASELRSAQDPRHGLQPPPRPRGSLSQGNRPMGPPSHGGSVTLPSRPRRYSPEQETLDQWSSPDRHSSERHSSERHSSDRGSLGRDNHLAELGSNHADTMQRINRPTHNDHHRKTMKPNETELKPVQTSIHAQTTYGSESTGLSTTDEEPHHSGRLMPITESPQHFPKGSEERIVQPQMIERQASIARVRSLQASHKLTPPTEAQAQNDTAPNKRESWATLENLLEGKTKPKDSLETKPNSSSAYSVNGGRLGEKYEGNGVISGKW